MVASDSQWIAITTLACAIAACVWWTSRHERNRWNWGQFALAWVAIDYLVPVAIEVAGLSAPPDTAMGLFPGLASRPESILLTAAATVALACGYILVQGRSRSTALAGDPLQELRASPSFAPLACVATLFLVGTWMWSHGGLGPSFANIYEFRARRLQPEGETARLFLSFTKSAWVFAAIALISIARRQRGGVPRTAWWWVLLGLSSVALVLRGGRGAIVNTGLAFLLSASKPSRIRWGLTGLVILIALGVLIAGKPSMTVLSYWFGGFSLSEAIAESQADLTGRTDIGSVASVLGTVGGNLSHFPVLAALAGSDAQLQPDPMIVLNELHIAFGKLLPAVIHEPDVENVCVRTTSMVYGYEESQVPPGIVAVGVLSFGVYGAAALAFRSGLALGAIERTWNRAWRAAGGVRRILDVVGGLTVSSGLIAMTLPDMVREVIALVIPVWMVIVLSKSVAIARRAPSSLMDTG